MANNTAYLSLKKLYSMSDDDLHALSLEKNPRGCATVNALKAQREIIRRNGGDSIGGQPRHGFTHLSDE